MAHQHSIYDTDTHFMIDPITRTIKNDQSKKVILIRGDHNSERFTFEMPRTVEGHDMTKCNVIQVHYINVGSGSDQVVKDVYIIDDFQISPDSDDVVIGSWLISSNATTYVGKLSFALKFQCLTGDIIDYQWATSPNSAISIADGIDNAEAVIEEYSDILEAWKAEIIEDIGGGGGSAEVESLDAEKVYFSKDLITTCAIGNIKLTNGQATIEATGKNLKQVWDSIFVKEANPSTTQPSVSLTFSQAKAYEVGTSVTPSYSATLNAGSYTYGPATGVTASAWEVTDTDDHSATTASGSFPAFTVADGESYKITAKATYGDGAIPLTNVGNEYADGQIKAGSKSTISGAVTGYRNTFYGTLETKSDITSAIVRGLTGKSGKALAAGNSFTVTIPVGALRVVIAYPATLRDVNSIKDVNGMNAEISSGFTKQTVAVEGANSYTAIDYKVYTMDFAAANDTANKFTVTI